MIPELGALIEFVRRRKQADVGQPITTGSSYAYTSISAWPKGGFKPKPRLRMQHMTWQRRKRRASRQGRRTRVMAHVDSVMAYCLPPLLQGLGRRLRQRGSEFDEAHGR